MSGAKSGKTVLARVVDALSLALVFGILYAGVRLVPGLRGDAGLLGALGFLLLAGTLMGELVEVVGLPQLTGYIATGVLAGPHVLALLDGMTLRRLAPINTFALALIALAGGAELHVDVLRRGLKSLSIATALQTILVCVGTAGLFILARPLIPFAQNLATGSLIAVALLWGAIATSRSPSATLALLTQTRAKGPLTSFALAFVMSSDVVVILLLALVLMVARPLIDPGAALSLDAFRELGHEIAGSVSIGTTLGLVLAGYLRLVGRQLLVVLIAIGFGASEVLHFLSFDPLLTFLVAGFVVQNLSRQGERFVHALDETGGVVYVLFFASAGADLDIPLLRALWPAALLLAVGRAVVTYGTARASSAVARDEPTLKRWAWTALIAQAGLTQGLAGVVERQYPAFGSPFRSLVIANVALNAIVGPILFKIALDREGETKPASPSLGEVDEGAPTST